MITLTKIDIADREYFLRINNEEYALRWMECDRPYDDELFFHILHYPLVTWYIIKDGRKKVGLFTSYSVNNKLFAGIIIDEQHRRQGYARKAFEVYLRSTDSYPTDTYLSCFIDQPAIELYRELGYVETGDAKMVRGKEFIEMKREYTN